MFSACAKAAARGPARWSPFSVVRNTHIHNNFPTTVGLAFPDCDVVAARLGFAFARRGKSVGVLPCFVNQVVHGPEILRFDADLDWAGDRFHELGDTLGNGRTAAHDDPLGTEAGAGL